MLYFFFLFCNLEPMLKGSVRKVILFSEFRETFTSWLSVHGVTILARVSIRKRRRWDDFFLAQDCKMHCPRDYFLNRCDSQLPHLENEHGGVRCFQSN